MTPQHRQMSPFSGLPFLGTAVGRIILITVGVFFIQNLVRGFSEMMMLTPRLAIEEFRVWQFVTYTANRKRGKDCRARAVPRGKDAAPSGLDATAELASGVPQTYFTARRTGRIMPVPSQRPVRCSGRG